NNLVEIVTGYKCPPEQLENAKQLYRLYDAAFDVAPDKGGFYYYLTYLNFGSTPLQVAQSFYGANAHGIHQMSNAEYVDFMY
ncbi:hypothetical protein, partial [Acinetobacter baumannii]